MAVNQEKFNAQQERVRKLAESYEGPEKKEVAELYVERIAKLKSAIMDSELSDIQKEDYLKRMDSYLGLVDAGNLQRLKKEYEPLLKSIETTLSPQTKELAADDREAKLDDVVDLKVRQELLKEWREATKLKQKFDSKKEQIELLIKTKNLEVEGTELQFFMTSIEFYNDFLSTKFQEYYETKDVGKKHEKLKDISEQGDVFFEVLTETEKRLREVNTQEDLVVIDLNNRNVLAEQMMFVKRKRYDENKKNLFKTMDDLHISKDDPMRQQLEQGLGACDEQFDSFKEMTLMATTPEDRTFQAEQANKLLDGANTAIEQSSKYLKLVDIKNTVGMRIPTMAKIVENKNCPTLVEKFLKGSSFGMLLIPQFAVGFGYYHASKQGGGDSTDTALEVADFAISLVPIVGGAYDCFAAIRGKTLSGRQMGTTERVVRGVIGLGSIVLDIFTFGVGGTLAKAGGKAALKAGAEISAHVAARAALEGGTKIAVKGGEEALLKGGVELAAKGGEEALAKGGAEVLVKGGEEALAKGGAQALEKGVGETLVKTEVQEAINSSVKSLTKEQQKLLLKVGEGTATAAERKVARELLKTVVGDAMKPFAEALGKKQAEKFAAQAAKVATRPATRVNRVLGALSFGGYKYGGMKGLEQGIVKGTAEKVMIEEALQAGKHVAGPYYLQAKFVKGGEVMWGSMAKSVGKDAAKAWWHMHNPMEVLRLFQTPGKWLKGLFRRVVKGVPGNVSMNKAALADIEQTAKATLISDGHDAKAVDALFADVKEKPWQQVLKENENNPLIKDPEIKEFFMTFQEQFPKSFGTQFGAVTDLYKGFKALDNDAVTSAKMAYDSRRMEWPAFFEKYKDKGNLGKLAETEIDAFKTQFENLHSMDRELPVNLSKMKEGQKAAKEGVKLSKEEVKKLRGELEALEAEKSEIESMMQEYKEAVASKEKGGKALSEREKEEIWLGMYEKLKDGPLKSAIKEKRDAVLKDMGVEVRAEVDELKSAEFSEFKKYTAHAMEGQVEFRLSDIEKRMAAKVDEVGTAQIMLEANQGVLKQGLNAPKKLESKGSPEEFAQKSSQEAKDAMAVEAKRQAIKKFEQNIKNLDSERAKITDIFKQFDKAREAKEIALAKKLSPQEELEVWYDVYSKLPAGPVKRAVESMQMKNSSLMAKEGTEQWKQEMGNITKQQTAKRRDDLEESLRGSREDLRKIDPNNPAAKEQIAVAPPPPSQVNTPAAKQAPSPQPQLSPEAIARDLGQRTEAFKSYLSKNKGNLSKEGVIKEMEKELGPLVANGSYHRGSTYFKKIEIDGKNFEVNVSSDGKLLLEEEKPFILKKSKGAGPKDQAAAA